ncbi:hypothetical protein EDD37DRAFT_162038 [Exophiala viscosa]|uniref:Zn(2)-C6 fungal-type domain-containing protein n=1 Tax=Exophiala viscosa TaxID=2486360 RepID=A0AAN6DMW1_9EURO|nr:hypothetical protein EDD36DRAFT_69105 [Exophiala viscosa]KAI1620607.1 hypothetical protein EDD37DRAFT_162038 [Exophiala viscosa]
MVGIPGRSEGCTTCRRRKVRCDLAKPSCQRCTSSQRQCEGYEKYPVFINRGQQGLQKRKRLEEARPAQSRHTEMIAPAVTSPHKQPSMASSPPCRYLLEDQCISVFWDGFSARSVTDSRPASDPAWLHHILNISSPVDTLRQTLLSLAYTRLGRLNDDPAAVLRGQQVYGQALKTMQQALYDPHWSRHDETLAAARCMVLYESFESTSESMTSWFNQIGGVAQIIELRGPQNHRRPLQRTILESMRYNVMIACTMRRKDSFFAQHQWLTEPWRDDIKNLEQRYIDQGFVLASMLERSDALSQRNSCDEFSTRRAVVDILRRLLDGLSNLQALSQELAEVEAQYARSKPAGYNVKELCTPQTGEVTIAVASATIMALELSYATLAAALVSRYTSKLQLDHDDSSILAGIRPYLDQSRRLTLSRQLLQDLETCLEGRNLDFTRGRLILPLNVVRWELREYPEDSAKIGELFDFATAKGKYRIARSVLKAGTSPLPDIVLNAKK